MNEYKINVCFEKNKIITALGELVQNDYNSTKLKFAFDKNGSKFLFKLKYPDDTIYVDEIVNNELIIGPGVLNQSGYYKYEICLYDTDNRLTDYAIGQIYVRTELVSTDEIVEPDDRVPVLDRLINDVNTLDSTVNANEAARQSNEQTRISNENTRIANETTRQSNEVAREEYITDLKQDVEDGKFDGKDGYTPQKGVDYYTNAEKEELKEEITDDIVGESTSQFNQNATEKTTAFNNNATDKLNAYNANHTEKLQAYNDNASDKLDEYNDNAQEKIDEFNENKEELQREVDYYKTTLNALPKVEGEGTSITLDDTAEAPMPMSLAPSELEQETTTGKNLIDEKVFTEENGYIKMWGYAENGNLNNSGLPTVKYMNVNMIANNSYTIRMDVNSISNGVPRYLKFIYHKIDTDTWEQTNMPQVTQVPTDLLFVFTPTSNVDKITFGIYSNTAYFYVKKATLQLVEGSYTSETMPDYEPYTGGNPAPNPEFPETIHTISGDNEVKVVNRNLFDKDNVIYVNNKILNDNGVEVSDGSGGYTKMYIQVMPNIQYTISGTVSGGSKRVYFFNKNKEFISRTEGYSADYKTFTTPGNCYYVDFQYYIPNNNFNIYQLEKDTTATPYTPHQEQSLPLNLPVENLFDKDNATYQNNKYKDTNGIETNSSASGYTTSYVEVKPDTQYTIQGSIKGTSQTSGIYFYDSSKNWISRETNSDTSSTGLFTFTTPNNCKYIQFQYIMAVYDANTIQIELGDKANSYTPFGTPALEYCKIGDYEDEFVYNTTDTSLELNKWYLKKNTFKRVLNGTENYRREAMNGYYFIYETLNVPENLKNAIIIIADKLLGQTPSRVITNGNVGISSRRNAGNRGVIIRLKQNETEMTVTQFCEFLAENNITFYSALATPTYILLNDTLQSQLTEIYKWVKAYQEQTNISQVNNDLPFVIKASAVKDLNKVIASLTNAIIEIGGE